MEIRKNGKTLDLGPDFSMQIDDTNPIFNERGSQSVPATVPVTRRNMEIMEGIHRPDAGVNPNLPEGSVDVIDGAYIRRGMLNVTDASLREGMTFNIGFDNSRAYQKWQNRNLRDLGNLPVRTPSREGDVMLTDLTIIYQGYDRNQNPDAPEWWDDLAVFPIAVRREEKEERDGKKNENPDWEILNTPTESRNLWMPSSVYRTLDGERTEVKVPYQYGVTAFVRIWKILELVFGDIGLSVERNPLKEDTELRRIVALNNTADAICRNELRYSDLMPDCSVQEFLNAMWVRFGLTYTVNFEEGKADVRLLNEILHGSTGPSLDELLTKRELIRYRGAEYVKMSAGTKIEGAAPATRRFEDYVGNLGSQNVKVGANVGHWTKGIDGQRWTQELYDGYVDDREDPDWDDRDGDRDDRPDWDYDWDDRDDDRDDGRDTYSLRSLRAVGTSEEDKEREAILGREVVTGKWYKLDATNGRTRENSSSFFDWDPEPEGMEAFELTSTDECVAVGQVQKDQDYEGDLFFRGYMPLYLVGSRHFHSYITGSDGNRMEEKEDGENTPLALMIAYTSGHSTVGRLTPEKENGRRTLLDDGSMPELTLYFQFADGLFARYWRDFDEILRHGNREVEAEIRIAKTKLSGTDMFEPVKIGGLRCLTDRMSYSLPSEGREANVEVTLRAIQPQGEYDIDKEQGIPGIRMGGY